MTAASSEDGDNQMGAHSSKATEADDLDNPPKLNTVGRFVSSMRSYILDRVAMGLKEESEFAEDINVVVPVHSTWEVDRFGRLLPSKAQFNAAVSNKAREPPGWEGGGASQVMFTWISAYPRRCEGGPLATWPEAGA